MEAVRAFNNELSGLYETKPPVSRAKMAQVTKGAIKAIKFYKHVVQSVEKFIQKCKPEYKVPGLYVIDSVVRQSRHQFGSQKDVFAPRFTKNIITTFQNLFKCPGDERSKIVRVLNLWQKNDVFPSEIVQPLLDLAADPTKPSLIAAAQAAVDKVLEASGKPPSSSQQQQHQQQQQHAPAGGESGDDSMNQAAAESMLATQNDMLNTVTQLLQQTNSGNTSLSAQQQQLQQLQLLQQQLIQQTALMQQPTGGAPLIDANLLAQIQALTNQLLQKTEAKPDEGGFNKKLLDFDYGESDDEEERRPTQQNITGDVQTILNDSGLMQQIHQVSQTIQKNNEYTTELTEQEKRRRVLEQQQAEFDHQIAQGVQQPPLPFGSQPPAPEEDFVEEGEYTEEVQDEDFREHQQFRDREDRDRRDRRRKSRDRSRSRTPKRRRRSRSRSRDRRRRSRSRDRHRRSRSKDREKKERERDRKKKGLPLVRANFVTICTTTIWIGHLNKFTSEEELKTELERYGPVENINMVPPRGCAYVVMSNRKDAYKAIDRLKGHKLNGSALKTAWAQSTGIRESEFKDSWDLDEGSMYIPCDNLPKDLSHFLEGAIIDAASLPEHLKDIPTEKVKVEQVEQPATSTGQVTSQPGMMNMAGQPPMPQMPGQPPMMGMMPGNMPPMPGMMPGMMMPMQRPVVPGMPPPAMQMTPGAPPQMMPGSQVPTLPGVRPPGAGVIPQMPAISIPSTAAANSLAQTIQNIMSTTAGVIPSSPSVPPRPTGLMPGMSPGGPQRFGFNPNMPPPGFRLPPPGFGSPMRPPLMGGPGPNNMPPTTKPSEPSQLGERLSMLAGQGMKQPEMAWPPDSNDKDDDMEEDDEINEDRSEIIQNNTSLPPGQFANAQNMPPRGMGQSPMRMMGPPPPGGFPPGGPPGPTNQPWNMNPRMGGPRQMRPLMGGPNMGPMGNPERFGGPMNQMMGGPGPRGPPFMGNMPGGPGFQRFGGPRGPNSGNIRGPVSLLDLDLKPKDTFVGESFNEEPVDEDIGEAEAEEVMEESFNEVQQDEPGEEEETSNCYPFNTWKSVRNNNNERNRDRSEGRDRSNRGRDYERDREDDDRGRDRRDSRDRDRHRSRDHGRSRERDRSRDRDRDRGSRDRGDRDRDWKRRDDRRDDRQDRDRDRDRSDRERSRRSRWSDVGDEKQNDNDKKEDTTSAQGEGLMVQGEEESTNNTVENSGNESENVQPNEISENIIENVNNSNVTETSDKKESDETSIETNDEIGGETNEETGIGGETKEETGVGGETNEETGVEKSDHVTETSECNKENIEHNENIDESSQNNGPVSEEKVETVTENKLEPDKTGEDNTETVQNVDMDLEEGEISS